MKTPQIRSAFTALADAITSLSDAHRVALEGVKEELKLNTDRVTELSTKLTVPTANPLTPKWPSHERPLLGAKRRLPHTPIPKPELPKSSQGKKVYSVPTVPIVTKPSIEENCWIWLASFPPSVTEVDISAMVKDCLSCDDNETIETKALVKKGVDISTLSSITFKVGVDKKYREAALNEDTWPAGVSFREFVDFGSKRYSDNSALGFAKTPRMETAMV